MGLQRRHWGELRAESALPGSDSDPGVYANDINSQPTPAGPRLTLVCRFALGLSELEWGGMRKVLVWWCLVWGWQPGCQFWCLTGPCLNMTQSFGLWYSPALPAPHISRSQLSFSDDTQPQLVYSHNLTITNQMMIKDSKSLMWKEKCHVFWLFGAIVSSSEVSISSPPSSRPSPLFDSPIQNIQTDE